ncbi:unnamed protein product [Caenorhabditis auriculariae]|uniref:Complexin-1 n=1 Tax=Caenorhabditis auriculariae TaxID=2777116 RepID=A0A8S1GVQ3_9PELO|nr:unnamed protein product [Caenorhabditis auriculariae]
MYWIGSDLLASHMEATATGIALSGIGLGSNPFSGFFKGGFEKLTGENDDNREEMEDPELVAARQEQERRRKDKHRKMEAEREKMRQNIRDKYKLKKRDDSSQEIAGRITSQRKTPEQVAIESNQVEDDGFLAQLGLTEPLERAKNAVTGAFTAAKGYFSFGFQK